MQIKRRALTAGATFFLAAATGHVMQNGGSISASLEVFRGTPQQTATPVSLPVEAVASAAPQAALPGIDAATIVSLKADANADSVPALAGGQSLGPRMLRVERGYQRPHTDADAQWSAFGLACADPVLVLSAKPGAMLGVHVAAPCAPSSAVRLTVDGLTVDAVTDESGTLDMDVPALSSKSLVTATLTDAPPLTASTTVSGLADVRRIAVAWTGGFDLALDAFENGAGWGDPGHVQTGAAPAPVGSGAILSLGDDAVPQPALARVYTGTAKGIAPKIEVSAEVTSRTCGRILTGKLMRAGEGGPAVESVSLTMPACDSLGGYVVLSVDAASVGPVSVASSGG